MEIAPPLTCLRIGKIGEGTDAEPDDILVVASLRRLTIQILCATLRVYVILLIDLDPGIDDTNHVKALRAQFGAQSGWIGETLAVPGEEAVTVHAVDIEVE